MLSICGSIYMNGNIVPFVRSVLDGASDPDGIEFSVVEDEAGSELMAKTFEEVRALTRNLKVLQVSKEDRVAYFRRCITFYERETIFAPERIAEFHARVDRYEDGDVPRIWFPPGRLYNRAVEASSGDVILNTPLDLLVHFDLSRIYLEFKAALAQREHLCVHFGLREGNPVRQHGLRMFDRALFDALKERDENYSDEEFSFEERWFHPAWHEDYWNEKAGRIGNAVAKGWEELFGERLLFSMPESPWAPVYLCEDIVRHSTHFLECFKRYLAMKGYEVK
jgi:hypothetical protein